MALTRDSWLRALDVAVQAEAAAVWLPVAHVRALGDHLYQLSFLPRQLRRGGFEGLDVGLDETFEGASVVHAAGRGQVPQWEGRARTVLAADGLITVRVRQGRPPAPRDGIRLTPVSFLAAARTWLVEHPHLDRSSAVPSGALGARLRLQNPSLSAARRPPATPRLRMKQRETLGLAGLPIGICWGPPGTGKTTTLGALVHRLVSAGERVLVVAPTNIAADGACLAIDRALGSEGRVRGDVLRTALPQLASEFASQNPDLLIWADLHRQYTAELLRVSAADERARADILLGHGVERDDALRRSAHANDARDALREVWQGSRDALLRDARVAVATVRMAVNGAWAGGFRHVVVDEASMVSVSDGLLLLLQQDEGAGAGRSLLLFGDHMQLGPIPPRPGAPGEDDAESDGQAPFPAADRHAASEEWFGTSILEEAMSGRHGEIPTVLLDEQSRMNPLLCGVVSERSYGGKLRAADGAPVGGRPPWLPAGVCLLDTLNPPAFLSRAAALVNIAYVKDVQPQTYQRESARWSVALARLLAEGGASVVLCSPYRAQAGLLRRAVADLGSVRAGTIHRLQGQEADVCILDPAQPTRWFIRESLAAPRLVNVAASRGRECFVLSNGRDFLLRNPHLAPFLTVAHILR